MKRSLSLKIVGVTLLAIGAFFTPSTSVAEVGLRYCVPTGNACPGPRTPFRCCGICRGAVCQDWPLGSSPQ
jgi:hypothetical protein